MNSVSDVIIMNKCNQTDEYNAVLRTKMCVHVRVLAILMLAAAAVLVVGAGVGAAATTWYVDDDGGDGIDFTKIQDAVNNASARDTIYVYDGVYNEHVAISASITLLGQSESGVTIDGGGSGNCVQVSSADVAINGFTITNASGYGLRADYSDLELENVTVNNNEGSGIYFVHGKSFTIRNSALDANAGGIIYYDAASGDAIVEDTTITNCVGSGIHIGLTEGKGAIVRNNRIDNSAGASSDGIYVNIGGSGGLMTIENNPVTKSGRYGIYLTGATNSTVSGNNVLKNSYGMRLYSSSNNTVFHNNFIENANYNANDNGNSNSWDGGYPTAGNYWSDHVGADDFKGPGQNQSGIDGIIDTPYPVQGGSGEDRYPLVDQWSLKGDLNSDHRLTPADATIALEIAAGSRMYDADTLAAADVSGDDRVTSLDAFMILQATAGTIALP